MPPKRPTPLLEELLEPCQPVAPKGGATLLGRINSSAASQMMKKAPDAVVGQILTPTKVVSIAEDVTNPLTPGALRHIITPVAATSPANSTACRTPQPWCFTPLATPSPSTRHRILEQLRSASVVKTSAASVPSQKLLQVPPQARAGTSGAAQALLAAGPLTYAISPASATEAVTEEATVQDSPVTPGFRKGMPEGAVDKENAASDEESDDESDDGDIQQVQALPGLADVPRPPPGALHPSVGSKGHALGVCKRCCFFPRGRCINGYECEFCHYMHDKRKRKGKKKAARKAALPLSSSALPSRALVEQQPRPATQMIAMGGVTYSPGVAMYPGHTMCQAAPVMQAVYPLAAGTTCCVLQPAQVVMAMPTCSPPQHPQRGHVPQGVITLEPATMPQRRCRGCIEVARALLTSEKMKPLLRC
eukprot:CAMPEP_0115746384 /NCGR_PEP_ID=MMETSP0272-20121206/92609_1 /TAXON_ID=71861 /ORGANISM="Scrippsiella trochoidea, Strain CCMP3099" /LENGTH=419 /DNA_ID=CAMNT_0003191323 /DNA_START=106 /DNA_END=1366 /DNA_ORIENTATION=+